MPATDHDPSLVRRVQKLLDKAAGTSNAHEAEAFAAKAAELAAAHRIDPDRLEREKVGDALVIRHVELGRGAYVRGRLALLTAIAEANDVRVLFSSAPSGTIAHLAGYRSDVDVVEAMYSSLHQQASAQMSAIRRNTGAATQRFRRSFLFGFADRLGEILAEARRAAEQSVAASAPATGASSTALVLRERADRVDEHVKDSFGRVRTARPPSAAQIGGWNAGVSAADRADIGRGRLGGRRALASSESST